jgi:hypothetical protein
MCFYSTTPLKTCITAKYTENDGMKENENIEESESDGMKVISSDKHAPVKGVAYVAMIEAALQSPGLLRFGDDR